MDQAVSKVLDVSWRFGVTAASSESDSVGKSFFQIKLCIDNKNEKENIFAEMSIAEFYKFLHDLEKVKRDLDLLV